MDLPFAEDINYWKTGKSSPDTWLERTRRQMENLSGVVLAEGFGSEPVSGRSAYMLAFELDGERYKVVWPVLPTKSGDEKAARIQAATLLYHDIKARAISAAVLGTRASFFAFLMLPDGRTASAIAAPEIAELMPRMLAAPIENLRGA